MGIKLEIIYWEIKADSGHDEQEKIQWNGFKAQNGAWSTSKKSRRGSTARRTNDEKTGEYITRVNKSDIRPTTSNWRQ